jgi:putative transposase
MGPSPLGLALTPVDGVALESVIVQRATVLAWHRPGFQLYWHWQSTANRVGRPRLDAEVRRLIRRMARENPTRRRRRIQAELALLGHEVADCCGSRARTGAG